MSKVATGHFMSKFYLCKRFFGRFAPEDAVHDEQTLESIRDNADGLRGTINM